MEQRRWLSPAPESPCVEDGLVREIAVDSYWRSFGYKRLACALPLGTLDAGCWRASNCKLEKHDEDGCERCSFSQSLSMTDGSLKSACSRSWLCAIIEWQGIVPFQLGKLVQDAGRTSLDWLFAALKLLELSQSWRRWILWRRRAGPLGGADVVKKG